jgi:predicted nuclease with TOPRIM domain
MEDDFLLQQLQEETNKLEEARKMVSDLEREVVEAKERIQVEREQQEALLDRFEELTRDCGITMKENYAKVKKIREQHKKDIKTADKKKGSAIQAGKKKGKK